MPGISAISILAGVVAAYGTFAIVAAIAGAIANAADADTEFSSNDWTGSGAVALLISAVTLFIAYLFGGYIAGRMARRRGVAHGVAVFITSIVLAAIAGVLVRAFTDDADIRENLRSIGAPTTWDQVSSVAIVGVIVALAAMLLGAILGGILGDRWHTKLERRAADPAYGSDLETRREAEAYRNVDDRRDAAAYRDAEARREADARRDDDDRRREPVAYRDDDDRRREAEAYRDDDSRREPATYRDDRPREGDTYRDEDARRQPVGSAGAGSYESDQANGMDRRTDDRERAELGEPGTRRDDEPVERSEEDRSSFIDRDVRR